ncbi:uncharacterized protein [Bombus fervidus]|uniref:uncharacterized protein n=1 Tax=Bombus fervidus TaxID=203811 RepID=UPI003D18949C
MQKFSYTQPISEITSSPQSRDIQGKNKGTNRPNLRINATTGRLPTVLLRSDGRRHKFLVDSGAGINILKRRCVLRPRIIKERKFSMGHSKFKTNEHVLVKLFGRTLEFFVVEDNFPIIEDGILGLPVLSKFKFELSNQQLKLDNNILLLQQENDVSPKQTVSKTVYLEGKPTTICFINGDTTSRKRRNQL